LDISVQDGTLIDQTTMFGPWLENIVNKFVAAFFDNGKLYAEARKSELYEHLGYVSEKKQFHSTSVVARGTNDDIINSVCALYSGDQFDEEKTRKMFNSVLESEEVSE